MKKIVLLLSLVISLSITAQEKTFFAEDNVSIVAPTGFKKVDFFKGFFNYSNGASIQIESVTDIAYVLVAEGFTQQNLEAQGVTLIKKENITNPNGQNGILITLRFNVTENEEIRQYERLSYLTGDMNKTIFLNANYPVLVKDLVYEAIKTSLLTAKFEN
jgi:hypothetical protein